MRGFATKKTPRESATEKKSLEAAPPGAIFPSMKPFPGRISIRVLAGVALAFSAADLRAGTAGVSATGTTNYPNAGMRLVKLTIAKDSPAGSSVYRSFYCGVIDEVNGYAYFSTAAAVNPGHIVKFNIRESPLTLREVGEADASAGDSNLDSGVIDPAAGYAYFGTTAAPGHIVRFALGAGDNPPTHAAADTLVLASGENNAFGAVIDTTDANPANHVAYFATGTTPGRVVKINLGTFTEAASITMPSGVGEDVLRRGVIDTVNGCAYFATAAGIPPRVVKINLRAGVNHDQMQRVNSIALDTVNNGIGGAVIDVANGFAYFGSYVGTVPAKVFKVPLNGTGALTTSMTTTLSFNARELSCGVIDPIAGYAFFGTDHTYPGKIHKVRLENATTAPTHIGFLPMPAGSVTPLPADGTNFLNSPPTLYGAVYMQSAMPQLARGCAYFGTDSQPGQVARVALGHAGAIKATKVVLGTTAYVTDVRFFTHTALGNVRLAIFDNASPMNLVWQSTPFANTGGTLVAQVGSTPLTLAPGTYWLAWQTDSTGDVPSYTAGSAGDGFIIEQDYGAFPATLTGTTSTSDKWTMYFNFGSNPVDGWRAANFGAQQSVASVAGNSADPNHNGVVNALEYALNGNPNAATASPLPVAGRTTVGGSDYLTLTFTRPLTATDVDYTVEVTGDLSSWDSGSHYASSGDTPTNGFTTQVSRTSSNGIETIVVRDNIALTSAGRRFIRLRAIVP